MSATTPINEIKTTTLSTIEIPEEENARTVMAGIEELAENIKLHGLLENLVVTNGGKGGQPYRLVAGFRRAAALKHLKWGDKPVNITIVAAQGRAIKNLVENIHRQDLSAADLAARLHDLSTGDYPREKGEAKVEYTKEMLAKELGLSVPHITNLIRAHANLAAPVKKAWQKHDLPQNLVFKCAAMTTTEEQVVELKDDKGKKLKDEDGNVKTKTIKVKVPDEAGQEKLLTRWQKAKEVEALAQKGEKKEKASAGGEGEGDGEGGDGAVERGGAKPGKKQLAEFIEKAKENLKAMTAEKLHETAEFYRLKGRLEGVQWAAGERDSLAPRG